MSAPIPTPIFRLVHVDNLKVILDRGVLHAPNYAPADDRELKTIHNLEIQGKRRLKKIPCGPRGVIHDYVPFYFGYLSPMLLQLKSGQVAGYQSGQEPLVYLVCTAQQVDAAGSRYVFSDGHGIAAFTAWYSSLDDLNKVDWCTVYLRYWRSDLDDMDRKRKKQAEFLIYQKCDWALVHEIGVMNSKMKARVERLLQPYSSHLHRPVVLHRDWYY